MKRLISIQNLVFFFILIKIQYINSIDIYYNDFSGRFLYSHFFSSLMFHNHHNLCKDLPLNKIDINENLLLIKSIALQIVHPCKCIEKKIKIILNQDQEKRFVN